MARAKKRLMAYVNAKPVTCRACFALPRFKFIGFIVFKP
jgi:hypothetical protein